MRHSAALILLGCATLATLIETSVAGSICPYCECLPSYSPVCGQIKETGKLRGFSSRCVLECTNKCRKIKYEFAFNGRCGQSTTISSTTETTTPSTTTEATTPSTITETTTPSTTTEATTPSTTTEATTPSTTWETTTAEEQGLPLDNSDSNSTPSE